MTTTRKPILPPSRLGPVALAAVLAACAPATTPLPAGGVTVTGKAALRAAYGLAAESLVKPWRADDVDHLRIFLRRGDATEVDLGEHPDVDAPIVIKHLRPDTAYAVRLQAYTADGDRIDANADDEDGDTDPEGCETTFTTTTALETELTGEDAFQVKLAPKTVDGGGTGTLVVSGGGVGDATAAIAAADATPDGGAIRGLARVAGQGTIVDGARLELAAGQTSTFLLPALKLDAEPLSRFAQLWIDHLEAPIGTRLVVAIGPTGSVADGDLAGLRAVRFTKTGTRAMTLEYAAGPGYTAFDAPTSLPTTNFPSNLRMQVQLAETAPGVVDHLFNIFQDSTKVATLPIGQNGFEHPAGMEIGLRFEAAPGAQSHFVYGPYNRDAAF